MVACCVVGCNVRSIGRDGKITQNGMSFYCFPAWKRNQGTYVSELTKARRMAWIAAVNREGFTFDNIPRSVKVCSRHFHSGKPAYEMSVSDPDWVPTLHLGHSETLGTDVSRLDVPPHSNPCLRLLERETQPNNPTERTEDERGGGPVDGEAEDGEHGMQAEVAAAVKVLTGAVVRPDQEDEEEEEEEEEEDELKELTEPAAKRPRVKRQLHKRKMLEEFVKDNTDKADEPYMNSTHTQACMDLEKATQRITQALQMREDVSDTQVCMDLEKATQCIIRALQHEAGRNQDLCVLIGQLREKEVESGRGLDSQVDANKQLKQKMDLLQKNLKASQKSLIEANKTIVKHLKEKHVSTTEANQFQEDEAETGWDFEMLVEADKRKTSELQKHLEEKDNSLMEANKTLLKHLREKQVVQKEVKQLREKVGETSRSLTEQVEANKQLKMKIDELQIHLEEKDNLLTQANQTVTFLQNELRELHLQLDPQSNGTLQDVNGSQVGLNHHKIGLRGLPHVSSKICLNEETFSLICEGSIGSPGQLDLTAEHERPDRLRRFVPEIEVEIDEGTSEADPQAMAVEEISLCAEDYVESDDEETL